MAFSGTRRLVGLGFGAIQAGLFVYEAQQTGVYAPPLVVDVRADLVAGVRAAGGRFRVNVARSDRIDVAELGPVHIADSSFAEGRARIAEAIAVADELCTALPSVAFYRTESPNSPHLLLATALQARTASHPLMVFCAENHRSAAALLGEAVLDVVEAGQRDLVRARVRFADTVIGKMSGVVGDATEIAALGLATVTPESSWAFLVEEFDRILVSRVDAIGGTDALHPGLAVLREVDDLAPFEDAKLLGHNATHALAGFLGTRLGLRLVADLCGVPGAPDFLRAAFIEESGRALIARHAGVDPLFTPEGFAEFADDLLARMVNPFLADTIERAARDPRRKLAWDDRLIGLIRVGMAEGVPMPRYSMGVAASLETLRSAAARRSASTRGGASADLELLASCWPPDVDPGEAQSVLGAVARGIKLLGRWRRDGFVGLRLDL